MHKHSDDQQGCYRLLADLPTAAARLELTSDALTRLARYRDTVNKIERCPNTERHLGERARDAENDTRVILRCALDSLNELFDSGTSHLIVSNAQKLPTGQGGELSLDAAFKGTREFFHEKMPNVDPVIFDEAERVIKDLKLAVKAERNQLAARLQTSDGKEHSLNFSGDSRPGDLGRVSSSSFFANIGQVIGSLDPAYADADCHHRPQRIQLAEPAHVDTYAYLVGALANARDAMARHTQVAEYFGKPHVRAHPVAVIIAIAIVAAVLIIAGATLLIGCATGAWSGSACDWGWGLLIAGAAVGVGLACVAAPGPCVIVIQGIAVAVVGA